MPHSFGSVAAFTINANSVIMPIKPDKAEHYDSWDRPQEGIIMTEQLQAKMQIIDKMTADELKAFFGTGSVTVTYSMKQ